MEKPIIPIIANCCCERMSVASSNADDILVKDAMTSHALEFGRVQVICASFFTANNETSARNVF